MADKCSRGHKGAWSAKFQRCSACEREASLVDAGRDRYVTKIVPVTEMPSIIVTAAVLARARAAVADEARRGRPAKGGRAMTVAERKRASRARKRG